MNCYDANYDNDDDDEMDDFMSEELHARLNDPELRESLPLDEALGDGACARRRRLHRPVRYLVGPLGRGRLPSRNCQRPIMREER